MENTTTRNKAQARKIESWILNQIAIRGASNVAKALGMDKSGITRWKESMLSKVWRTVTYRLATLEEQDGTARSCTNGIFQECRNSAAMKRVLMVWGRVGV